MRITLEFDEQALANLPLGPGERERHMQIELACRYHARGWLSFAQAARRKGLTVGGLLGELLHARQAGVPPGLGPEPGRLRSEAGFFVDPEIERFILSQVSE